MDDDDHKMKVKNLTNKLLAYFEKKRIGAHIVFDSVLHIFSVICHGSNMSCEDFELLTRKLLEDYQERYASRK